MRNARVRTITVAAGCLVLAVAITGCGGGTGGAAASGNGQELLNARCTGCHDLTRVEDTKADASGWESTVERMQSKGAQLSDEEKKTLVEYLAATYGE